MSRISAKNRELLLNQYYDRFHKPEYLEWDPLTVVREFNGSEQQEYVALVSAILAFGGVKQIIASVRNVVTRLDLKAMKSLHSLDEKTLQNRLSGFTHRIYIDRDLVLLTLLYQQSVKKFGSLGLHFSSHHDPSGETIEAGLRGVIKDYKKWAEELQFTPGAHYLHMLNSPEQGSTCKRWLMFLKWMIRADDGIDLGIWNQIPGMRPDQLLIPLDTHLFKISKTLGLTQKRTPNWKTSIEVTRNLKKTDPLDPTRFDFSLCRFGMFDYRKLL